MGTAVVLGSGIVGSAAAWDLVRRGHEVVVADASAQACEAAAEIAGAAARQVDATDLAEIRELLEASDLVISGLPYRFGTAIAQVAVETSTHYLDFGGNPVIVRRQLELDSAAKGTEVVVVPDSGLAPGMANVLAVGAATAIGGSEINELRLRVGALPARPTGALGYQLAFNPAGLINEYAEQCDVLRDGSLAIEEPLTGVEDLQWEPFGVLEAFHTAGGSSTLPAQFEGRVQDLDYKTLRYPGHVAPFRAMFEIGLFAETPQASTKAVPRDVLLEALSENLPHGHDDLVLIRIWARGSGGAFGYEVVDRNDGRFSALARTTAFPTTALAHRILQGEHDPGARTMGEAMLAPDLISELEPVGIRIERFDPTDP